MRAVVQRVLSAKVVVDGETISQIGPGLLVLLGLLETDTDTDSEYIIRKVLNMRIFQNENNGKAWDQSVMHRNYEILLVSQFTLYGILKGNKPDFHVAMAPQLAKPFYDALVGKFQKAYVEDRIKGFNVHETDPGCMAPFYAYDYMLRWTFGKFPLPLYFGPDGRFGAMMQVHLVNDGPVTIQLDSSKSNSKD